MIMRNLNINDKCYKFFWTETKKISGPSSIVYKAYTDYSDKKLFFFRRDEAIASLKRLLYFMGYGDAMAEIIVDKDLVKNSGVSSPEHFSTKSFKTGEIYKPDSEEILDLVLQAMRECKDFSKRNFLDVVEVLIRNQAFNSALIVYSTIKKEKQIELSKQEEIIFMELSSQPWREKISLKSASSCSSIEEFINLLKKII